MKRSLESLEPCKRIKKDDDDKLDPVEKLLHLSSSHNQDWNLEAPVSHKQMAPEEEYFPDLQGLNYSQVLNERILRHYYSRIRKAKLEDPAFTQLNQETPKETPTPERKVPEAPFFRNVNFGQSKSKSSSMEDYFSYDEGESDDEPASPTDVVTPSLPLFDLKKCQYYRQSQLNLAAEEEEEMYSQPIVEDYNKWFKRPCAAGTPEVVAGGNDLSIRDFFV